MTKKLDREQYQIQRRRRAYKRLVRKLTKLPYKNQRKSPIIEQILETGSYEKPAPTIKKTILRKA